MRDLDYTLILLTHGRNPVLGRCVESFARYVRPRPARAVAVVDGAGSRPPVEPLGGWEIHESPEPEGFCTATARCWRLAAAAETRYVVHLEGDFLVAVDVELSPLADVLDDSAHLSQMLLRRQPVNSDEQRVGGYVALHPEAYVEHWSPGGLWLEGSAFGWSTNPSLFRSDLARRYEWEEGPECEGKLGVRLIADGYHVGVWGSRHEAPAVIHAGKRSGFGY